MLPRALAVLGARSLSIVPKVKRMLGVWANRAVFPADIIAKFEEAVDDPDSILTGPLGLWWQCDSRSGDACNCPLAGFRRL